MKTQMTRQIVIVKTRALMEMERAHEYKTPTDSSRDGKIGREKEAKRRKSLYDFHYPSEVLQPHFLCLAILSCLLSKHFMLQNQFFSASVASRLKWSFSKERAFASADEEREAGFSRLPSFE